jgi:hypothetical protein
VIGVAGPHHIGCHLPAGRRRTAQQPQPSWERLGRPTKGRHSSNGKRPRLRGGTRWQWVGGLFEDMWDDMSLAFCSCCVFGWNMSRAFATCTCTSQRNLLHLRPGDHQCGRRDCEGHTGAARRLPLPARRRDGFWRSPACVAPAPRRRPPARCTTPAAHLPPVQRVSPSNCLPAYERSASASTRPPPANARLRASGHRTLESRLTEDRRCSLERANG